jgi:CubicO group peptidase (beta-lactamase class C family)
MNTTTPEQLGLSSERLGRIDTLFDRAIGQGTLPGAITAVVRRGRIAHLASHGAMDLERHRPMRPDTLFRIYSMTKPITAVAVMLLLEEAELLIYDPVRKYLPDVGGLEVLVDRSNGRGDREALHRDITIKDLLTHTSGLGYVLDGNEPADALMQRADLYGPLLDIPAPLPDFVQRLCQLPLAFQPGTSWHYSAAYDVLGHLVSVVADTPFDVFLQDRLFGPLGMDDTGFFVPPEKRDRFAALYEFGESGDLSLIDAPERSPFLDPAITPSGGGGLISSAADVLRFATLLQRGGRLDGNQILGRRTVDFMTRDHLPAGFGPLTSGSIPIPGLGYGLGFGVISSATDGGTLLSQGSYAWSGFAGTLFWVDPHEELVAVLMTQVMGLALDPEHPILPLFQNLVCQAIID